MWSNLSLSSLASSLTDLSTQVTSTVTSTASNLTSTAVHFIEDQKRSYEEETAKIEQKRQKEQYDASHNPPPALPLWHTFSEDKSVLEAELKQRILRLATDPRTFLSSAPDPALFPFSLELALPHIQLALQNDPLLARMQYRLVPRKVSERQFWTNYMYRVSMVREQMEVGELFEVGRVEAEVERERSREERLKAQEEAIERDRKDRQDRIKGALKSDAAGAKSASDPGGERKQQQQEVKFKEDNNNNKSQQQTSTTTSTTSTTPSQPTTQPIPQPTPAQRRDSEPDMEEFVSDEYVHVASQDVALLGSMRKEMGLVQPVGGGQGQVGGVGGGKGVVGGGGGGGVAGDVGEAELDELESMLADADVDADASAAGADGDELLEELEGELTEERNLP